MPTYLEYVNTAAGLVGLVLTIVALWRIQAVRRAQRSERTLVRALYGADSAAAQLRAAAAYLDRSRDAKARQLAHDLVRVCGQIEGVSRALDAADGGPAGPERRSLVSLREDGYFSQDFLLDVVQRSHHELDILAYRPLVLSTASVLDAIRASAERGVRVRILALSPAASDEVLTHSAALLPSAAADRPDQLRAQLVEAEQRLVSHLFGPRPTPGTRISYRRYGTVPGPHFVRADSTVCLGFVGLLSGPVPTRFDERVHVEVALTSRLGEQVMVHFEQLWQRSAAPRCSRRPDQEGNECWGA